MFNKINMKWLIGSFIVLMLFSVLVLLFNQSKSTVSKNRTFKSELTDFDTASVTRITIIPKTGGEPIDLTNSTGVWNVRINDMEYNADPSAIKGMLANLKSLRATRIAANSKDQWAKYDVTDSAATHVVINEGKKVVLDIYLGKFSYQQPKNVNPYMQQQGTMTSYVRIAGDKHVYATDGMIAMSFNRQPNDFRNRILIRSDKEKWNRLAFTTPNSSFDLTKQGNNWMIDGLAADSASVVSYLSFLARLSSSAFVEESVRTSEDPLYTLSIEGENMFEPIIIQAFPADTVNIYAISSSMNKGTYFSGSKNGLFDKIFIEKNSLLGSPSKNTNQP